MAKIIHSMIRVRKLEDSIRFYNEALGLQVAERFDFDSFSLVYLRNEESDMEIELTHNHSQQEPYELGNGYGHIAVAVDDLIVTRERLLKSGYQPGEIKRFNHQDRLLAEFFFCSDPDGYKIEFLKRQGSYK